MGLGVLLLGRSIGSGKSSNIPQFIKCSFFSVSIFRETDIRSDEEKEKPEESKMKKMEFTNWATYCAGCYPWYNRRRQSSLRPECMPFFFFPSQFILSKLFTIIGIKWTELRRIVIQDAYLIYRLIDALFLPHHMEVFHLIQQSNLTFIQEIDCEFSSCESAKY